MSLVHTPGTAPKYMGWNLVLAWVPVAFGYALYWCVCRGAPRAISAAVAISWLVFLPNAPYLVTDLVHAGTPYGGSTRLDIVTLIMFAVTGLVMFFAAITPAIEAIRISAHARWTRVVVPVCALAASIGMYLGRVLRWNSWDLVARPWSRLETASPFFGTTAYTFKAVAFVTAMTLLLIASRAVLAQVLLRQRS